MYYNTAKLENEQVLKAFNITLGNTGRYQALENEETEVEEKEGVEGHFQVMKKTCII